MPTREEEMRLLIAEARAYGEIDFVKCLCAHAEEADRLLAAVSPEWDWLTCKQPAKRVVVMPNTDSWSGPGID